MWKLNTLVLFIAFAIPGFIALKTYELLLPSTYKDSAKRLIDAVAYSCINYALLIWPIYFVESTNIASTYPGWYTAFYVFVVLIAPVLWAYLYVKFRGARFVMRALPHPTDKPWDFVFAQRKPYWVIVTLNNGTRVAGRYDSASFASSAPAPEQIYLEEAWALNEDGGFERPRVDSAGVLILSPDIATVELFNIIDGDGNEPKE